MPVDAEKNKLQNCYLGFLKFWKFWKIFNIFFIFSKNPKFQNFQKTGIYALEESLKNVCTKFQVIPFISVVFIALWMWKMATFQGIWTYYDAFPYFHFIPISMQQAMF